MRYQALSSVSFNSKTPLPIDGIGLTSNLSGIAPPAFLVTKYQNPKRIDFGHDLRMSQESPSHAIIATRGISRCATFSIYRKLSIIATTLPPSLGAAATGQGGSVAMSFNSG